MSLVAWNIGGKSCIITTLDIFIYTRLAWAVSENDKNNKSKAYSTPPWSLLMDSKRNFDSDHQKTCLWTSFFENHLLFTLQQLPAGKRNFYICGQVIVLM